MAQNSLPRPKGRSRKSPEILHLRGAQVVPGMDHPKVVAAARKSAAAREAAREELPQRAPQRLSGSHCLSPDSGVRGRSARNC